MTATYDGKKHHSDLWEWEGNTSELLDGLLDEVALSPEDMKDLMKKGFKGILDVAALNKLATSRADIKSQWGGLSQTILIAKKIEFIS